MEWNSTCSNDVARHIAPNIDEPVVDFGLDKLL